MVKIKKLFEKILKSFLGFRKQLEPIAVTFFSYTPELLQMRLESLDIFWEHSSGWVLKVLQESGLLRIFCIYGTLPRKIARKSIVVAIFETFLPPSSRSVVPCEFLQDVEESRSPHSFGTCVTSPKKIFLNFLSISKSRLPFGIWRHS